MRFFFDRCMSVRLAMMVDAYEIASAGGRFPAPSARVIGVGRMRIGSPR
jgi:hypothetical protein